MAGKGRPVAPDPKTIKVTIRLSSSEKALLQKYSEKVGMTMADVIRQRISDIIRW